MSPDRTDGHHRGQVCAADNASSRQCPARAPEHPPCVFPGVPAAQEAGMMLSSSDPDTLFLKGSTWVTTGASLLLVLVLFLVGTLGFTWKIYQKREQECQTKGWEKSRKVKDLSSPPHVTYGHSLVSALPRKEPSLEVRTQIWSQILVQPVTAGTTLDWRTARIYAAAVTLDPDTANLELCVSEDCRSVRRRLPGQHVPENSRRFLRDPCVLGQEAFSSGRHYWEVEVGDRTFWGLSVCDESSEKAWGIRESPQSGFWTLERCANKHWALTCPPTLLPLSSPPTRVGIFLDYEAGGVSFYNAAGGSHIYTFPRAAFSSPLRPYFSLWFFHPCPLTLCH